MSGVRRASNPPECNEREEMRGDGDDAEYEEAGVVLDDEAAWRRRDTIAL